MLSDSEEQNQNLSPLKRALFALKDMRAKLDAVEQARTEPIAIVGMACRFPGTASSPEGYWQMLRDGVHAVSEVPPERWDVDAYYDPDPEALGKMYTRWGGFLQNLDQFDPQFFGISPREAVMMDPQHRLLLEMSWEALERAGQSPDELVGSTTGVFIGISANDYQQIQMKANGLNDINAHFGTGGAINVAVGRIAYVLGLHGPTMAIDTACSSSLVAVHQACQSLRTQQTNMAIAGGVNLILAPDSTICLSKVKALSPDSRCKTFDAAADGYVRGEGCGVVVLKRLSDAVAAGDPIMAVIRGTAVNHDGRSSGLTVPSGPAQQAAIRAALADAGGIAPHMIGYAEAHGTGTPLGDPIEVRALAGALGEGRTADTPLLLGSVKTNLGHLESAAGISGLMKVVLMLQNNAIPPHLHLREPNPFIEWDELPVKIVTELTPWLPSETPRLACVNSFGFSGTNAHVVIGEAPTLPVTIPEVERPTHLFTISAKTEAALRMQAERNAQYLSQHPEAALADVCYTSNAGRAQFAHRLAVVTDSNEQLHERLAAFASGQEANGVVYGRAERTEQSKVAFLFTGQGAQYMGMGQQLYHTQPVFRAALDRCAELLQPHLRCNIRDIIFAQSVETGALLDDTTYTQPALFALEYALSELWRSWGITPTVVLGHSVGEYVAAVVAGVLSLEDGLKLIAARGRLMGALPAGGAMAAIFAPEAQVRALLAPHRAELAIAAVNGPEHTVIAGTAAAVQIIADAFAATGVRVQRLTVSHAFHSPMMEPMLAEFERVAASVRFQPPRIALISNVTGQLAGAEMLTPAYWRRHVREPVQFAAAITVAQQQGVTEFVECGPHPVLLGMGQHCLPSGTGNWMPSLRKNRDDWQQMLASLGALYIHGVTPDWVEFDQPYGRRKVVLPTYPFQRKRYWFEQNPQALADKAEQRRNAANDVHPLLGQQIRSPLLKETLFETTVSATSPAFLADHQVYGAAVFPGSAYLEMALAAAGINQPHAHVETLTIRAPLTLSDAERKLQLVLAPTGQDAATFQILSLDPSVHNGEWTIHAAGSLRFTPDDLVAPTAIALDEVTARCDETLEIEPYYQQLADLGLAYGPAFRGLTQLHRRDGEALAQVQLPRGAGSSAGYQLHPALLDACFQTLGAALPAKMAEDLSTMYVPMEMHGLRFYRPTPSSVWCHIQIDAAVDTSAPTLNGSVEIVDDAGQIIATLERLDLKRAPRAAWQPRRDNIFYERVWRSMPRIATEAAQTTEPATWVLFSPAEFDSSLATALVTNGGQVVNVQPGSATTQLAPNLWQLDPSDPDAPRQLFAALRDTHPPLVGVVHLWALAPEPKTNTLADFHHSQQRIGASALHIAQTLAANADPAVRLWLVTKGAQGITAGEPVNVDAAVLWGMARSVVTEYPELQCFCVDLDPTAVNPVAGLADELLAPSRENQLAFRAETRYAARLTRHAPSQPPLSDGQAYQLGFASRGSLDNLMFQPLTRRTPAAGEVEIAVRATGLNFRDVLNVLGMYPGDPGMPGLECAGIVSALGPDVSGLKVGDAVVALGPNSFDSFMLASKTLVAPKPKTLSFAAAATIPNTFLTAAYGLRQLANIRPGDKVLIHSAAGGVGLAAVQIVQQAGAEVFATAGSPAKHAYLRSQGVKHIFSSRTLDFAEQIRTVTNGYGVDIVLNSLADEFITQSFALLAPGGRFLEIGKRGIWTHEQVAETRPDVAYFPYDLGEVLRDQPALLPALLRALLAEIDSGALHPLPLRAFPVTAVQDAFRFMAQAKHIGKVVVTHSEPSAAVQPVRPDASYLITGGLGGLGLAMAAGLVAQGARHLALVGRRAPNAAAETAIATLQEAGAQVRVLAADIGCADDVARVLETISAEMPALRGVIHAAGVLDDGVLAQQHWERFRRVLGAKVDGAWLLDQHTRGYDLDWFVLCSSVSALLGSAGQANYAAANASLDALAHARRAAGLPATSINWGAWAEVGMAAGLDQRDQRRMAERGMSALAPKEGVTALLELLSQESPQIAVLPINWTALLRQFPAGSEPVLLDEIAHEVPKPAVSATTIDDSDAFAQQLQSTAADQRVPLLTERLHRILGRVLGLDASETLNVHQPLDELGLDSLMAVELKNRIETDLRVSLPVSVLLSVAGIADMAEKVDAQLATQTSAETIQTEEHEANGTNGASQTDEQTLAHLDELSDDDVSRMLSAMLTEH